MNNIKNKRTGLKLLGSVSNGKYRRFTMNKTQQHQPVYSSVQPRCPGIRGNRGAQPCSGSNTKVGCKSCPGCFYNIDVSSNAFNGAFPTFGSFASVNVKVDSSANEPCEWQYNAIVESFSLTTTAPGARIQLNIEDERCINVNSIESVYFYAPVGGTLGVYTGSYRLCDGTLENSLYPISVTESKFIKTSKRMGAPYRNPIAGFRKALNCDYKACTKDGVSNTSNWKKQPTNTVYKDNYSGKKGNCANGPEPFPENGCGCCPTDCSSGKIVHRSGIQARTHRPIIRSGMQEKNVCCKSSNGKCSNKNDYAFSYRQYQNNKRCLSFERSQEKYIGRYACFGPDGKCQNKFRKSGCASCCACCVKTQRLKFFFPSAPSTLLTVGDTLTQVVNGENVIGTITEVEDSALFGGQQFYKLVIRDNNSNTCPGLQIGPATSSKTLTTGFIPGIATLATTIGVGDCRSNKSNLVTIYKPNNKKFSKQGAVSSGSRLDRLKLDTIKSANSKCKKGKGRCKIIKSKFIDGGFYKVPKGKYDAGQPRFTGWMFNGHHQEVKGRVYNMVRYNQQPLGIPQLTQNPAGKTCIKKCFPRQLNLGSNRPTAAGNRARIPGSKCLNSGRCPCSDCNKDSLQTFQGVPCCK